MKTKSCREYRQMAWDTTALRRGDLVLLMLGIFFVPLVVIGAFSAIGTFCTNFALTNNLFIGLITCAMVVLEFAFSGVLLSLVRREEVGNSLWDETCALVKKHFKNYLLSYIVMMVIVVALSIITFGIAGIIFGLAYAMVPFIIKDHPEMSPTEVLRASRMMMRGHKWDLFCLMLSYIGWILLCILTCYILALWVSPAMMAAQAHFYEDIKGEETEVIPVAE